MLDNCNDPYNYTFWTRRWVKVGESSFQDRFTETLDGFIQESNGKIQVIEVGEYYDETTDTFDECNQVIGEFDDINKALVFAKDYFGVT